MSVDNHVDAILLDIGEAEDLLNASQNPLMSTRNFSNKLRKIGRHRRRYELHLDDDTFYRHETLPEFLQLMDRYNAIYLGLAARLELS
jgi:hypothetical protein